MGRQETVIWIILAHALAAAWIATYEGWGTAFAAVGYFWLFMLGCAFFLHPLVAFIAGPRAAIVVSVVVSAFFAWQWATGSIPYMPPPDDETCYDRQGAHSC